MARKVDGKISFKLLNFATGRQSLGFGGGGEGKR